MRATCHCGAVVLEVDLLDGLKTAGRCTCSFCRRRAAPTIVAHKDALRIVQGQDHLTLYQWGTQTARHYFSRHAASTCTTTNAPTPTILV